jgi:Flp pilus assembly protein TadD
MRSATRRPSPRLTHRRLFLGLLVTGSLILVVTFLLRSGDRPSVPGSAAGAATTGPATDYSGTEVCATCHAAEHAAWQDSVHGKAGGSPQDVRLIAPFNGDPIRFSDATVRPTVDAGGRAAFTVTWRDRTPETFVVEGVVGGGHMAGGGTQGFFSKSPDGTLRFLPFDYSRQLDQWFCRSQPDGRWLPITDDRPLTSCTDWPPRRTLGAVQGAASCDQCHGSQIQVRFDSARKAWETTYTSLSINCESCHGPGVRHVELARSGRMNRAADIGMAALDMVDKRRSVGVCLQCHGEKLALDAPGAVLRPDEFGQRYSLLFPILTDPPYTPDFRHRKFGYQGPHLASACFLDGAMTCTDCHDPHAQHYRDDLRRPLDGRFDNRQCTSCHPSKRDDVTAHTFHRADSAGSTCVSCHMPYLQHPSVGPAVPYARADHTVSIPRPVDDERFGIATACRTCHEARSPIQLAEDIQQWWGEIRPRHPLVTAVMRAGDGATLDEAGAILLRPDLDAPILQFAALSQYLLRFVRPSTGLPPPARASILALTRSSDVDVASLALAVLQVAEGHLEQTRQFVGSRAAAEPGVKARLVLAVSYIAWVQQLGGRVDRAGRILANAVDVLPGDAGLLEELGGVLGQLGDTRGGLSMLAESTRLDPGRVLTHMVVGMMHERARDWRSARDAYSRAVDINPWDPLSQMRLAMAHLALGDTDAAAVRLERVTALDRSNVQAHVLLTRILLERGQGQAARETVETALAFAPTNPDALELRALVAR